MSMNYERGISMSQYEQSEADVEVSDITEDYSAEAPLVMQDSDGEDDYRYNIDTFTNAIPVERLVDDFVKKIIDVPEFQRPYVWNKRDAKTARHRPSVFIDSILQGLPIPPITIYRDATARESGLLIDGRQRLTTLAWFIHGMLNGKDISFSLRGEGIRKAWINKDFSQLEDKYKQVLLRSYVPVTYVRQLTDDVPKLPNASSLYVLFDRLNSGGYTLHPHEKRAVLITHNSSYKILNEFLKKIYSNENWDVVFSKTNQVKEDYRYTLYTENIFRLYPCLLYVEHYKGILARFLDDFMINYEMTEEVSFRLISATDASLILLHEVQKRLNQVLFSPFGKLNIAFYEMFVSSLIKALYNDQSIDIERVIRCYKQIQESSSFYDSEDKKKTKSDVQSLKARLSSTYELMVRG